MMRTAVVLVAVLALSGCASSTPIGTTPIAGDLTGEWAPIAGSDADGVFTLLPQTGTLIFGNGESVQSTGCGMYEQNPLNDDLVVTTSAFITRCMGPTDVDARIAAELADATSAVIGDTLYLTGDDFELELEQVKPVSIDDLQGDWTFTGARQSDMIEVTDDFTLTITGSTLKADCVTGSLSPVSGLNVLDDLVVTGPCRQVGPQPLDVMLAKPFLVHLNGTSLDLVDVSTSTHYGFTR